MALLTTEREAEAGTVRSMDEDWINAECTRGFDVHATSSPSGKSHAPVYRFTHHRVAIPSAQRFDAGTLNEARMGFAS
jgi:hypothetical protein